MHICKHLHVCGCNCSLLTLCLPAGNHRGHMLEMKMDVYHRELGVGGKAPQEEL